MDESGMGAGAVSVSIAMKSKTTYGKIERQAQEASANSGGNASERAQDERSNHQGDETRSLLTPLSTVTEKPRRRSGNRAKPVKLLATNGPLAQR